MIATDNDESSRPRFARFAADVLAGGYRPRPRRASFPTSRGSLKFGRTGPFVSSVTLQGRRIILVDATVSTREVVARRLRAQGYVVEEAADPATGADMALCAPPAAVVADLWMPSISGVQLCRLLRSEPATAPPRRSGGGWGAVHAGHRWNAGGPRI